MSEATTPSLTAQQLLTRAQADAVYSAMCALNNVSGYLDAVMQGIRVKEHANGVVQITRKGASEDYASQIAFATAYELRDRVSAPFPNLFNAAREQASERLQNIRDDKYGFYTPEDLESAEREKALIEQEISAVLTTLELAAQAKEALVNILLHPRNGMTPADQKARDKLAEELADHLDAIGA